MRDHCVCRLYGTLQEDRQTNKRKKEAFEFEFQGIFNPKCAVNKAVHVCILKPRIWIIIQFVELLNDLPSKAKGLWAICTKIQGVVGHNASQTDQTWHFNSLIFTVMNPPAYHTSHLITCADHSSTSIHYNSTQLVTESTHDINGSENCLQNTFFL